MPYDITDAKEDIQMLDYKLNELVKYLTDKGIIQLPKKEDKK